MVHVNLDIVYVRRDGKEVFVPFVFATQDAQRMGCAPMERVYAQMVMIIYFKHLTSN